MKILSTLAVAAVLAVGIATVSPATSSAAYGDSSLACRDLSGLAQISLPNGVVAADVDLRVQHRRRQLALLAVVLHERDVELLLRRRAAPVDRHPPRIHRQHPCVQPRAAPSRPGMGSAVRHGRSLRRLGQPRRLHDKHRRLGGLDGDVP